MKPSDQNAPRRHVHPVARLAPRTALVGGGLLLASGEAFYVAAGSMSIVFSFAIFALELLVAALQAYIFTVLSAQYISSAIAEEH